MPVGWPERLGDGALTHEQLLVLGEECCNDATCHGMMRNGRPLTNVEMDAMLRYSSHERRKAEQFIKDEL